MDVALVFAICCLGGYSLFAALVRPVLWKLNVC